MRGHFPDATKMVSDTPRTDAAYAASTGAGIYELFKESQDIERELNAANQIIRQQQLLEEENFRLTDKIKQLYEGAEEQKLRIKRLEEAGNELIWAFCPASVSMMTERESDALKLWNKAKEAKP